MEKDKTASEKNSLMIESKTTMEHLIESSSPASTADIVEPDYSGFSSSRWLAYFHDNLKARCTIQFAAKLKISDELRVPLTRSLQRFQIGETGEGKHLRKFARTLNDPAYEACIDLFIKEEQFHARVLAQIIAGMDGELLSWHWTDVAFIALRRLMGLKTELLILLIAEIVGKCFYRSLADKLEDGLLSDAFALIVLDELGHLEFHCSFLQAQLETLPPLVKRAVYWGWTIIFFSACFVFVIDHRKTLSALGVDRAHFIADCSTTFERCARRVLPH